MADLNSICTIGVSYFKTISKSAEVVIGSLMSTDVLQMSKKQKRFNQKTNDCF